MVTYLAVGRSWTYMCHTACPLCAEPPHIYLPPWALTSCGVWRGTYASQKVSGVHNPPPHTPLPLWALTSCVVPPVSALILPNQLPNQWGHYLWLGSIYIPGVFIIIVQNTWFVDMSKAECLPEIFKSERSERLLSQRVDLTRPVSNGQKGRNAACEPRGA